jgi:photosystem II stability/assembly factor-like uncharacterized protein
MILKIGYTCGLLAVLLLSVALVPSLVQARPAALKWTSVDKPGITGETVVSPSEVNEIAIGRSGVLYAIDSENSKIYRSLDGGVTWEDVTDKLESEGAGLPASKIAVAPDKSGILAVVTDGSSGVYLSTDGGMNWTDTGVPSLDGTKIQAIAISKEYTQDSKEFREIAIGTADWGDNTTSGQVWVYQIGKSWASWQDQELTVDSDSLDPTNGEVSALTYSPDFPDDITILVVASTSSDVAGYEDKTWLCIGERDTLEGTTSWNTLTDYGYPVKIWETGDGPEGDYGDAPEVDWIHSSLALPSDYSSEEESSRWLFVSYDREPDADDDVYLLEDTLAVRLDANIDHPGNPIDISSIAYHGTITSGKLLAGDVSSAGSNTVQVRRATEPFDASTTWEFSTVPPTGPGNAKLGWSPDGEIAYCGTGQSPGEGEALDESALSASVDDGDKWRQLGLIDTGVRLTDIVPAPDGESLFVTTYSPYGPEGIWRSTSDPLGRYWERLLTMDTDTDAVILGISPNYSEDYTIYAAEVGGKLMAVSHNRGNTWNWRQAPRPVIDIVVENEDTLYLALPDGAIKKSTKGGHVWRNQGDTFLSDINMLAIAGEETILVGGRNGEVAYSTDGGASFTQIRKVIGSGTGDVQVIADANYQENGVIYAATNLSDEGIWRWVIGVSTRWEQIDESITELEGGQQIGGLAVGRKGTLYALRLESATSASGGVIRSVNPSVLDPAEVEFDLVNKALPEDTAFDPTLEPNPVFPNTLPYLKLSGDVELNELWTIDTANQIIYRFRDTLCKLGPTPITPEAGGDIPVDPTGYITDFTLQWEELAGATEYEVAIYLDSDAIAKVWSGITTYTAIIATEGSNPAQLISGTKYYWRVRSIEPIKSPWSELYPFSAALGVVQWSPLVTSTGVSPSPSATNVSIRPAFTWGSADGATSYEFVLARDSEFTDVVVSLTGADALQTTAWGCDRDLDYSTTYFWKVRAISAISYSKWGTNTFTTEAAPSVPLPSPSPLPPPVPEPAPTIPSYLLGVLIGTSVTLVVALFVVTVRRRR